MTTYTGLFTPTLLEEDLKRLEKTYQTINDEIDVKSKVICVGKGKQPFGNLLKRIPSEKPIKSIFNEILKSLKHERRIALFGFYMLKVLHPESVIDYLQFLEELECTLFDFWPVEFCYGKEDFALKKAYDVILNVENLSDFYDENVYSVYISETILHNFPPIKKRFKIKGFKFVEE